MIQEKLLAWLKSFAPEPTNIDITTPYAIRHKALCAHFTLQSICLVWIAFMAIFLLLIAAYFSELDIIVRGYGQVVPSQRVQHIQNLEGGIMEELLIKEGDSVTQGSVVARIENTLAGSQYREALQRKLNFEATVARLQALIQNTEPKYPTEVQAHAELIFRHNNILAAIREQQQAEYAVLTLQMNAVENKYQEALTEKKNTEAQLSIAQKQKKLATNALRAQAYSQLEFLNLEQKEQELVSKLDVLTHSIPRLALEKQEKAERVKQYQAELLRAHNEELGKVQAELISVKELLKAGSDKVQRTELISPVNGIIKNIYYTTIGGVIPPGQTILDIVPFDDSLIIEAKFSPADIGFLSVGQKVTVRLTAYDFTTYGSVEGTVENIGADAVEDKQGQIFFLVKIRTKQAYLPYQNRQLPILAGMQVEADIITGKKSIMDYILKPLLRIGHKALREQ